MPASQAPLVPIDLIPDAVALLRQLGNHAVADQVEKYVAACRETGEEIKVRIKASGTLEKFVGDRQPGDEPFEILTWDDTGAHDPVPRLAFRRRANVEPCNYCPRARLADGRIVGRDYFPEEQDAA